MRILYTADIHVHPDHLHDMVRAALAHKVDALIVGGDVVPHRLPGQTGQDLLEVHAGYLETVLVPSLIRLKEQRQIRIFLDLGNDDFAANRNILEACSPDPISLLHMQRQALTPQVDLVGYMMVPPTPFARKDWEKSDTLQRPYHPGTHVRLDGYISTGNRMQAIELDIHTRETIESDLARLSTRVKKPFIFVAHCPPYDTALDLLMDGTHVGSRSIRNFIAQWSAAGRLVAALHGHIHESPSISGTNHCRINNALCINPGQADALQYVILELDPAAGAIRIQHTAP